MNNQPNTKPKEKDPTKGIEDTNEKELDEEGEIQALQPGVAQSPIQSPTILLENMMMS